MHRETSMKQRILTGAIRQCLLGATLLPALAMAQTVPAGNTAPVVYTDTGATPPAQIVDGQPGAPGSDGAAFNVELETAQSIWSGTASALVQVGSTGGNGANGGYSVANNNEDGPLGGVGGKGGDVNATMDAPSNLKYSVLEAISPNAIGVQLSSQGGNAGDGLQNIGVGNGGVGGTGGNGGNVSFTMPVNPSEAGQLSYISATGAAINATSVGGNGGSSGEGLAEVAQKITGRKGGSAGSGGAVNISVAGNINGVTGGSGIIATSFGGNGGTGGNVTDYTATATGADGGNAGAGGNVNVAVTGGIVTAQGPDQASTGPVQTFDSSSDPSQTVPLDTSVTAGGIIAVSRGGVGGVAGMVNGSVTHGGNGAQGGAGGDVEISIGGSGLAALQNNTVVGTTGYNAFGAMALSAGGNGGNGSSGSGVYFRSGGAGGTGGNAGAARIEVGNDTATPYARIQTTGDDSDALVALSVGGGGGYSGDVNDTSTGGGAGFSLYVGGVGGVGGNASVASISNGYYDVPPTNGGPRYFHTGDVITTTGTYSRGMVAQSVGGGGGRGGDATSTSLESTVSIGGKGGQGGTGNLASAVNFGLISTSGAQSAGIFSQSVGGGGGAGGGALSRVVGAQISASIAVGGDGGKGGDALEADAYNLGQVQTLGGNAHAIFAQSVGGGGGVGGTAAAENYSTSLPDSPSISLTSAVGGKGGTAGMGGAVDVMNSGLLQTQGKDAYGVFAQSVGGGGGAGGDATASSMAYQQAKLNVTTAIGGKGGAGGDGNKVNVWNSGLVNTSADTAIGIFAQSVGGGGGTGGFSTTDQGGVYQAGGYSTELSLAIGGQGGASGNGQDVMVANYINSTASDPGAFSDTAALSDRDITGAGGIMTTGDMAAGIFAQSVGGGGGHGGDATGKGGNGQLSVNVAIGGGGGSGGDGGNVSVHNGTGAIATYGAQSYGIFAQSVGGGGGTGGNAATGSGDDPEYAFPNQAEKLAAGSTVSNPKDITPVTDVIWDWKDNVKGAWDDKNRLQELYELNSDINTAEKPKFYGLTATDLTVDVGGGAGGTGGAGGDGRTVTIDSSGSISTRGAMSYGMFGQSVGGGGGVGGASAPSTANDQLHDAGVESSISVGGSGGKGGNGGDVSLTNNAGGQIQTSGDLAFGMFAQSIGGGGGVGGASTPNAGLGNPMALSLGASAVDSGDFVSGKGGQANLTNAGSITTTGDHGVGMLAQSVGGGGGIATVAGQTQNPDTGMFDTTTRSLVTGAVTPTLGANYLSSKNVGGNTNVMLNSGGSISTQGVNAMGILAQSVGGGGGLIVVDENNQVTVNELAQNTTVSPHGGNNAGLVNVTTQGSTAVITSGAGAVGIVAQSLGGGGALVNGFNGVNVNTGSQQVYQNRWNMGMGGAVTVNNNSDIFTTGDYAHGIFAQVSSGTGGVIGRSDGTGVVFRSGMGDQMYCGGKSVVAGGDCGGAVAVNLQAGTIDVKGAHSWGVVAESENVSNYEAGYEWNEDMSSASVNVASGARVIAEGNADGAILLNASGTNTVVNSGVIQGNNSAGGYAINSVGKSYKVTNQVGGVIEGSFGSKCSGTCQDVPAPEVNIQNDGVIASGATMDLGAGSINNDGTLDIHGSKLGVTNLTGNYSGGGNLVFDADYAKKQSDRLVVSGTANVGGTVTVNPTSIRNSQVALMTAEGGLTLDPKLTASRKLLFDTKLDNDGKTLYATPVARFSDQASGLDATSRVVAGHLQSLFDGGATMDKGFASLAKLDSADQYGTALRSVTGRALGSMGAFRYQASRGFVGNMNQGCAEVDSPVADCTWGRAQFSDTEQDETSSALGYQANAATYEMGLQKQVRDDLSIGAGVGYEDSHFSDADNLTRVNGKGLLAGVGARYKSGNYDLSAIVDGGYGDYDSKRYVIMGDTADIANGKPKLWNAGLHLSAAYTEQFGRAYVKPFAELHAINVHNDGYTESGGSGFNMAIQSSNNVLFGGAVGTEVGSTFSVGDAAKLRVFGSAAVQLGSDEDWRTTARFADQSTDDNFSVRTQLPTTLGRVAVGASLLNWKNVDLSVSYVTEFGGGYRSDSGVAKLDWRF